MKRWRVRGHEFRVGERRGWIWSVESVETGRIAYQTMFWAAAVRIAIGRNRLGASG